MKMPKNEAEMRIWWMEGWEPVFRNMHGAICPADLATRWEQPIVKGEAILVVFRPPGDPWRFDTFSPRVELADGAVRTLNEIQAFAPGLLHPLLSNTTDKTEAVVSDEKHVVIGDGRPRRADKLAAVWRNPDPLDRAQSLFNLAFDEGWAGEDYDDQIHGALRAGMVAALATGYEDAIEGMRRVYSEDENVDSDPSAVRNAWLRARLAERAP